MTANLILLYATYLHATPDYHARRITALQAELAWTRRVVRCGMVQKAA